jgi:hypothetical protein
MKVFYALSTFYVRYSFNFHFCPTVLCLRSLLVAAENFSLYRSFATNFLFLYFLYYANFSCTQKIPTCSIEHKNPQQPRTVYKTNCTV